MRKKFAIDRKGVSTKVVCEFLADPQWTKDEDSTNFLKRDVVYRDSDGRVLVVFSSGRGCLYNTKEDFAEFIKIYTQLKTTKPTHILKNRLLYGENFIQHVPELIEQLATTLKIPRDKLDKSMNSLLIIEPKVKRLGRSKCLETSIFAGVVAYVGEVMIANIPGGRWQMRLSDQSPDVWEPWIIDPQGRICNSWSYLFDMLAEPSVPITIRGAATIPITGRHVPVPPEGRRLAVMMAIQKPKNEGE